MRKLLKTLAVVALGIFATSCATDLADNGIVAGQSVKVSFTPDLQMTREVGNAENVNKLFVNVYSADGQTHYPNASKVVENYDPAGQAVELELVTGMTYMISFWAQKDDLHTVDGSTTEVSINFTEGNDDNRDAFFAVETISVNGPDSKHIKLYRPFAQLNFGASDLQNALNAGFELTGVTVATKTYSKFNLLTGEVDGLRDIEFTAPARMDGNVPTNSGTYDWLAMNYILLKEDQNFDTKLTINNKNGDDIVIEEPNVPFRRNWRTNVVGKLLTSTTGFIVEVIPGFVGEILVSSIVDTSSVISGVSIELEAGEGAAIEINGQLEKENVTPVSGITIYGSDKFTGVHIHDSSIKADVGISNPTSETNQILIENVDFNCSEAAIHLQYETTVIISGCNFTIPTGAKLIKKDVQGSAQVIVNVNNCTINGNSATIAEYEALCEGGYFEVFAYN